MKLYDRTMGASRRSRTGFADYLDLLRVFDERQAEALIVGGQAVNFWAEVSKDDELVLRRSHHPKLFNFVAKRLPGWQQLLGSHDIS